MVLDLSKIVQIKLVLKKSYLLDQYQAYDNVCGYNILPKFVNQLIASSIQIIQIYSRHLLSYYMPISLVYYYTGVFHLCTTSTIRAYFTCVLLYGRISFHLCTTIRAYFVTYGHFCLYIYIYTVYIFIFLF